MKRPSLSLFGLLLLTACVTPGASVQSVDGTGLSIRQDDNYFWPDSFTHKAPDGTQQEIDVFPIVTALVVRRADGAALTEADEAAARAAVEAHCRAEGTKPPPANSRFADGTWAFPLCA